MIKIMPKFLLLLLCLLLPVRSFATTVNVAVPSFSMSLIAFMAAKERGYYQQEGLDINFVLMPAAIASRALIAGNVDLLLLVVLLSPRLLVERRYDCFSARSVDHYSGFTQDPISLRLRI